MDCLKSSQPVQSSPERVILYTVVLCYLMKPNLFHDTLY